MINHLVCEGVEPDLTIMLMVSDAEAVRRTKETDRLESENKLFFIRVRNGYKTIARENPTRVKMIEVDGLSEADLHSQIINIIDNALKSKNAK